MAYIAKNGLKSLFIVEERYTNFDFLTACTQLTCLQIPSSPVDSFEFLRGLTNLTSISNRHIKPWFNYMLNSSVNWLKKVTR